MCLTLLNYLLNLCPLPEFFASRGTKKQSPSNRQSSQASWVCILSYLGHPLIIIASNVCVSVRTHGQAQQTPPTSLVLLGLSTLPLVCISWVPDFSGSNRLLCPADTFPLLELCFSSLEVNLASSYAFHFFLLCIKFWFKSLAVFITDILKGLYTESTI